ncbi:MAG: copper resistance protein CopC [Hyphomonadaceae bacterium]|nr:copper resistance protein CopC [Hyphomonadaceae bacterium]
MKRLVMAIAAAALVTLATPALAHTTVRETNIAENATLARAPATFTIVFSGATGLANITLTDSTGCVVALNYTPPRQMTSSFAIPLPALTPGAYTLAWRTIAHDGHAMPGAVHFTISG